MKELFSAMGSVVTALVAAVCCLGPVLFTALGVSVGSAGFLAGSAQFAKGLIPYRLLFIGLTILFLAISFYFVYRRKADCATNPACSINTMNRTKTALWIITGIAMILILMPYILAIGN